MRKIESAGKATSSAAFSSRAVCRSEPKGFSMTTRRQASAPVDLSSTRPESFSCFATIGKSRGGIER